MTIIGSCGHRLSNNDGEHGLGISVMYQSENCDPISGFQRSITYASVCQSCRDQYAEWGILVKTEEEAMNWVSEDLANNGDSAELPEARIKDHGHTEGSLLGPRFPSIFMNEAAQSLFDFAKSSTYRWKIFSEELRTVVQDRRGSEVRWRDLWRLVDEEDIVQAGEKTYDRL